MLVCGSKANTVSSPVAPISTNHIYLTLSASPRSWTTCRSRAPYHVRVEWKAETPDPHSGIWAYNRNVREEQHHTCDERIERMRVYLYAKP